MDIGDAGNDDLYVSNATTLTADTELTITSTNRKAYKAAGSIRLKVTGGTIASGKIGFTALIGKIPLVANAAFPTAPVVGA